ncbi:unnamed protein product [Mytilus edulis]|uniref:ZAD domain-containing protein n=1 Tax=Mytilus edulis TaxID=6550 RepID=A0A8S3TMC4_MYTED|nr:unnamed protein product [Mytilus edulis]
MATPIKKENVTCFCCLSAGQTRSFKLGGKKCEETSLVNIISSYLDSTIVTELVNCQAPICRGCLNFIEKWNIFKIMMKENADSYSQKENVFRTKRMYNSPCESLSKCEEVSKGYKKSKSTSRSSAKKMIILTEPGEPLVNQILDNSMDGTIGKIDQINDHHDHCYFVRTTGKPQTERAMEINIENKHESELKTGILQLFRTCLNV